MKLPAAPLSERPAADGLPGAPQTEAPPDALFAALLTLITARTAPAEGQTPKTPAGDVPVADLPAEAAPTDGEPAKDAPASAVPAVAPTADLAAALPLPVVAVAAQPAAKPAHRATPATPAAPARPAAPATPGTPAALATPAAPATPATTTAPATDQPEPASPAPASFPAPAAPHHARAEQPHAAAPATPALPATRAAPARPAARQPVADAPAPAPRATPAQPATPARKAATADAPAPATATAVAPKETAAAKPHAAEPSEPRPVLRAERIEALVRLATRQGAAEARMELHPQELGSVVVKLRVTSDGLQATFTASNPAAVPQLQQAGDDLRRSLEAKGLTLATLDVRAQSGDAGDRRGQHRGSAQRRAARALALAAEEQPVFTSIPAGELVDVHA
jgi:flagellar hook-length control protein FliK